MPHRTAHLAYAHRRKIVLETTMHLLAQKGPQDVGLRSVCLEMKVAPSLMARYFKGWHEQLVATHQMIAATYLSELASVLDAPFGNERVQISEFVRCCLSSRWAGKDAGPALVALCQLTQAVPELRNSVEQFQAARQQMVRSALVRVATKSGAAITLDATVSMFLLLVDGSWLQQRSDACRDQERDTFELCWSWLAETVGMPDWQSRSGGNAFLEENDS